MNSSTLLIKLLKFKVYINFFNVNSKLFVIYNNTY